LRLSWSELSTRERNLFHINAIATITGSAEALAWAEVRAG
jgi:hypothetical protein